MLPGVMYWVINETVMIAIMTYLAASVFEIRRSRKEALLVFVLYHLAGTVLHGIFGRNITDIIGLFLPVWQIIALAIWIKYACRGDFIYNLSIFILYSQISKLGFALMLVTEKIILGHFLYIGVYERVLFMITATVMQAVIIGILLRLRILEKLPARLVRIYLYANFAIFSIHYMDRIRRGFRGMDSNWYLFFMYFYVPFTLLLILTVFDITLRKERIYLFLQRETDMQYQLFNILHDTQIKIREIRHDIGNHMEIVRAGRTMDINHEISGYYLQKVMHYMEDFHVRKYSRNRLLDLLLRNREEMFQRDAIRFWAEEIREGTDEAMGREVLYICESLLQLVYCFGRGWDEENKQVHILIEKKEDFWKIQTRQNIPRRFFFQYTAKKRHMIRETIDFIRFEGGDAEYFRKGADWMVEVILPIREQGECYD